MKAEELMIGDWVHVEAHRGFNAQNVKVETIPDNDGDYEYGHHYGHIGAWLDGGDNDFRDVEAKHLQPIPLTTEILEKNGFEKALQLSDTEPFDTDEDGNKHYSYNKTFWGWFQPDKIFCIPANGMGWLYIKYVHQLQHALKLCGIEKEIEL